MRLKNIFRVLFIVSLAATIVSFILNSDIYSGPMLLTAAVFLTLWLFALKTDASQEGKAVFYALISYAIVSIILSYALSIVVPIYGQQWGFEFHPDDGSFPIINDGRENCLLTTAIFLFYFSILGIQKLRLKMARPRAA
jgi:hypothetical protein